MPACGARELSPSVLHLPPPRPGEHPEETWATSIWKNYSTWPHLGLEEWEMSSLGEPQLCPWRDKQEGRQRGWQSPLAQPFTHLTLLSFALHSSSRFLKRSCWCGPEWATSPSLRWHWWPLCNDSDLYSVGWLEPGRPMLSKHWWPHALHSGWQSKMLSPPNQTKIPENQNTVFN